MSDPFVKLGPITSKDLPPCERDRRFRKKPMSIQDSVNPKPKRKKRVDLNPFQKRWFTDNGYTFARVEHSNAYGAVTVDLWGFADYIACKPGEIILVQTTTHENASARIKKAKNIPEFWKWLESGGRYQLHGWRQPGGFGTKWEVVIQEITA